MGLNGDGLLFSGGTDDPGFAFVLEAIAVALDLNDLAVAREPIEHGGGQDLVTGDGLIPGAEAEVRGPDPRTLFVAGGDDLEEQVRLFAVQRQVFDLVDIQEAHPGQVSQVMRQTPLPLRGLHFEDQVGGCGELGFDPGAGRLVAHGDRKMGPADAGVAGEDSVLVAGDEGQRSELLELPFRRGAG